MQKLTNEAFLNKPLILIVEFENPTIDLSKVKVDFKHTWKRRTYDLKWVSKTFGHANFHW